VNPVFERVRDGARFIGITVALTVIYLLLLLMQAGQRIFDMLESTGVFDAEERWAEEARTVAAASIEADRRLPPTYRLDACASAFRWGSRASGWDLRPRSDQMRRRGHARPSPIGSGRPKPSPGRSA
jgi:hypothetical protein